MVMYLARDQDQRRRSRDPGNKHPYNLAQQLPDEDRLWHHLTVAEGCDVVREWRADCFLRPLGKVLCDAIWRIL